MAGTEQGPGTSDWRGTPNYYERVAHTAPSSPLPRFDSEAGAIEFIGDRVDHEVSGAELPDVGRVLLRDILSSLAPAFMPAGRLSRYPTNEAAGSGAITRSVRGRMIDPATEAVAAFQYNAQHVLRYGPIVPTLRDITFNMVTIDHGSLTGGESRVSRYVDWNSVMAQLGIVGTQRPLLGKHAGRGRLIR